MNSQIRSLGILAITLAASPAAWADGHISININPFGWGAPPPVVYESPRYEEPPPVVYSGRGRWGRGHERRDHDHDRGHHDDDGDRRR